MTTVRLPEGENVISSSEALTSSLTRFHAFINVMFRYFWVRGYCHGNLEPSNILFIKESKLQLIDLEHLSLYHGEMDTVGFFVYMWRGDIRRILREFCGVCDIDNNGYWVYDSFNLSDSTHQDIYSSFVSDLLKKPPSEKINFNRTMKAFINILLDIHFVNNSLSS